MWGQGILSPTYKEDLCTQINSGRGPHGLFWCFRLKFEIWVHEPFPLRCSSTQTFDMKEAAHAIAGTRVVTAVVLLVGVQSGSPTRGVRRERRGRAQQVRNAYACSL